ncbi:MULTISPECIES: hypothetical protein [unclassified Crossiella]|uniref:hypothetical protein n=1 Tax=unclassified Crossiella TaxID=2620835 RepID=UPI001FFFB739|nr:MULTISPECIES: hypothetical protein [unclassified Crossiella]MCK2237714.1 hypothetical protein [Crossiella sp. S99.2]MCK2255000.1 hypothetical protein [Crossiella sp. S99.1]
MVDGHQGAVRPRCPQRLPPRTRSAAAITTPHRIGSRSTLTTPTPSPAPAADDLAALHRKIEQLTAQLATAEGQLGQTAEHQTARTAAEERATVAEARLGRLLAARAAGLPDALAERLSGSTEDELTADAAALHALITPAAPPEPPAPPAAPAPPIPPSQPVEALRPAGTTDANPSIEDPDSIAKLVYGG